MINQPYLRCGKLRTGAYYTSYHTIESCSMTGLGRSSVAGYCQAVDIYIQAARAEV